MSDEGPSAAPAPAATSPPRTPAPPPPRLSLLLTIALSVLVLPYLIAWPLLLPLLEGRVAPIESLREPGRDLERLVEREMDLARALRGASAWEWWLYTGGGAPADAAREARDWYEELFEIDDAPWARLEHAVLVAESGGGLRAALAQWAASPARDERLESWLRAAYVDAPPPPAEGRPVIGEVREELGRGWFADTLVLRLAERIGDRDTAQAADAAIAARGAALVRRLRVLVAIGFGLVAAGAVALAWPARRRAPPIGSAALPASWPTGDGWALFVRGLGAPQALALSFFYVVRRETPLDPVVGMLADLVLFAWVLGYLRRRGREPTEVFGLVPAAGAGGRLLRVTVALIGLTLAGDLAIDLVGPLAGLRAHWSDGFPEDLLWAPRWRLALDAFDAIVWAPVVEEITFRGLLYATLRTRLGPLPAAGVSALVFVLPHDYGLAGSLSVLWSGVIWALAYERTRSLLPGILAHAANNAISTAWALFTLRL